MMIVCPECGCTEVEWQLVGCERLLLCEECVGKAHDEDRLVSALGLAVPPPAVSTQEFVDALAEFAAIVGARSWRQALGLLVTLLRGGEVVTMDGVSLGTFMEPGEFERLVAAERQRLAR
jgi:hypothetical protein